MKKSVFSGISLKMASEPSSGRVFQNLGAAVETLLSPNMTLRLLGTTSAVALFCDRKFIVGLYTCNKFLIYT